VNYVRRLADPETLRETQSRFLIAAQADKPEGLTQRRSSASLFYSQRLVTRFVPVPYTRVYVGEQCRYTARCNVCTANVCIRVLAVRTCACVRAGMCVRACEYVPAHRAGEPLLLPSSLPRPRAPPRPTAPCGYIFIRVAKVRRAALFAAEGGVNFFG